MLRFAFVLAILSVLFSRSESQLIKEYGIKVGVATINQYWHYSSSEFVNVNNSPRQGVDAGIFVEWFNVPLISLLTEVHYIQNGKSSLINVSDGDIYTNLINYYSLFPSDYLSVPLLVKIRLEETILTPYILAGQDLIFISIIVMMNLEYMRLMDQDRSILEEHLALELKHRLFFRFILAQNSDIVQTFEIIIHYFFQIYL